MSNTKLTYTDRNAHSTIFGFQFQVFVGILMALYYINKMSSITIEGKDQDVEIQLNDSRMIYCQAKSCSKNDAIATNKTSWSNQLSSGMNSLFQDYVFHKRKGDLGINKFIYAINYFFPFGDVKDEHGNGEYFGKDSYMDIDGDELNTSQTDTIINHLKEYNKNDSQVLNDIKTFKTSFLRKLEIVIYKFLNFRHFDTKFDKLEQYIQQFLSVNQFDINVNELTYFWFSLFHDNATHDGKVSISKNQFVMSIFAIYSGDIQDSQFKNMGNSDEIDSNDKKDIINRFKHFIEKRRNTSLFNGMILEDVYKFFGINTISHFHKNEKRIRQFAKIYQPRYEKLFEIKRLPRADNGLMTRFAIIDWLNNLKFINDLLDNNIDGIKKH